MVLVIGRLMIRVTGELSYWKPIYFE